MSLLTVYDETGLGLGVFSDEYAFIAQELEQLGVCFERWQTIDGLDFETESILKAHHEDIERIKKRFSFESVDVISMSPDHPNRNELRAKFLKEHTHSDFEVRFFVDGLGLFFLHCKNKIYAILCQQGDLISVPAGVPHWFDMGEKPNLKCIRFFTTAEGWVADYTGSDIANQFPLLEDFLQETV